MLDKTFCAQHKLCARTQCYRKPNDKELTQINDYHHVSWANFHKEGERVCLLFLEHNEDTKTPM